MVLPPRLLRPLPRPARPGRVRVALALSRAVVIHLHPAVVGRAGPGRRVGEHGRPLDRREAGRRRGAGRRLREEGAVGAVVAVRAQEQILDVAEQGGEVVGGLALIVFVVENGLVRWVVGREPQGKLRRGSRATEVGAIAWHFLSFTLGNLCTSCMTHQVAELVDNFSSSWLVHQVAQLPEKLLFRRLINDYDCEPDAQ